MLFLKSVPGDIVFLSWLYPRAAFWTLDRANVKGHQGVTLLRDEDEDDEEEPESDTEEKGIGSTDRSFSKNLLSRSAESLGYGTLSGRNHADRFRDVRSKRSI